MTNVDKLVVATLIATFMLQTGLGAPPGSLRRISGAAITRGLLVMFVLGPALAYAVVSALAPPRPVAVAIIVASTVGVIPLAARGVRARHGHVSTAIVLTFILAMMAAFVAVPFARFLLATHRHAELAPQRMLLQLVVLQVLPLLVGAFIARKSTRAPEIAAFIGKVNLVVMVLAVVTIVAPRARGVVALGARGMLAVAVFALLLGAIAFAVGGPSREERHAIVSISNKPNVGVALAIIESAEAPPVFSAAVVSVFLVRVVIGFGIDVLLGARARRRRASLPLASLVLVLAVSLAPRTAHAQLLLEPPESRLEGPKELEEGRIPNRKLLAAGAPVLLVPYVSSLIGAAAVASDSSVYLAVPLAGPWITLGTRQCPCQLEGLSGALLVVDGVFQAAGVFAIARAFFVPEHERKPVGITVDVTLNGIMTTGRF